MAAVVANVSLVAGYWKRRAEPAAIPAQRPPLRKDWPSWRRFSRLHPTLHSPQPAWRNGWSAHTTPRITPRELSVKRPRFSDGFLGACRDRFSCAEVRVKIILRYWYIIIDRISKGCKMRLWANGQELRFESSALAPPSLQDWRRRANWRGSWRRWWRP